MTTNKEIKTIGVLTSGGDAPGMNAAIRAVVRRGLSRGINMKGILKGYSGLMNEEIIDMTAVDVSDTIQKVVQSCILPVVQKCVHRKDRRELPRYVKTRH